MVMVGLESLTRPGLTGVTRPCTIGDSYSRKARGAGLGGGVLVQGFYRGVRAVSCRKDLGFPSLPR